MSFIIGTALSKNFCCRLILLPIGILFFLFLGWAGQLLPPDASGEKKPFEPGENGMLSVGEDLTYEVSWAFFKLGTIRTRVLRSEKAGDGPLYTATCSMDSYEGLFIPSLHAVFESLLDTACFSRSFVAYMKEGDRWNTTRYVFDRASKKLYTEEGFVSSGISGPVTVQKKDTINVEVNSLDGLSMFYFAREHVRSGMDLTVSTVIEAKPMQTDFRFYHKRTDVEIDAVPFPVDVIEFDGEAKFSGIYGLTGPFKGWFSNDDARIPIKAKLEIYLGSITVELKEWSRPGWNPSPYREH